MARRRRILPSDSAGGSSRPIGAGHLATFTVADRANRAIPEKWGDVPEDELGNLPEDVPEDRP